MKVGAVIKYIQQSSFLLVVIACAASAIANEDIEPIDRPQRVEVTAPKPKKPEDRPPLSEVMKSFHKSRFDSMIPDWVRDKFRPAVIRDGDSADSIRPAAVNNQSRGPSNNNTDTSCSGGELPQTSPVGPNPVVYATGEKLLPQIDALASGEAPTKFSI